MELIVSYLIYILGIIAIVAIICVARVRLHMLNLKSEIFKLLMDKKYNVDNIDLNNYIK